MTTDPRTAAEAAFKSGRTNGTPYTPGPRQATARPPENGSPHASVADAFETITGIPKPHPEKTDMTVLRLRIDTDRILDGLETMIDGFVAEFEKVVEDAISEVVAPREILDIAPGDPRGFPSDPDRPSDHGEIRQGVSCPKGWSPTPPAYGSDSGLVTLTNAEFNGFISEAVSEAVEAAEAQAAHNHAEALRALEGDHERNMETATAKAYEAGYASGRRAIFKEYCLSSPEADVVANLVKVREELASARENFPRSRTTFAALVEEVGELAKALMEEPRENVEAEAIQVATMALRVILDGDRSFDGAREARTLDPLAGAEAAS